MKKLIAGIALVAIMAGCLVAGNTSSLSENTSPLVGDRNGVIIV